LGGFYAHFYGSLTPSTLMHTSKTVEILAIAYIGGRGSLWGGIAVAFPFVFFIEYLRSNFTDLPGLHLVIYGLMMIIVMIFYPNGFSGFVAWSKTKIETLLSKNTASWKNIPARALRVGQSIEIDADSRNQPALVDNPIHLCGFCNPAFSFWLIGLTWRTLC